MIDRATGRTAEARAATPERVVAGFTDDPRRPDVWVFDRTSRDFGSLAVRGPASDGDRARAARLRGPGLAEDLLARRAAVRRVLAAYVGRRAEDLRIVTLPGGKPALVPHVEDRRALSWSAAHSADVFCVAVGSAASLGVDVERQRTVSRALPIAVRWFSRGETAYLRALPEEDFRAEFLRLWTAKEALAKRHSAGLRLLGGRGEPELDVSWESATGTLVPFVPRDAYLGALASTDRVEEVRLVREACRAV